LISCDLQLPHVFKTYDVHLSIYNPYSIVKETLIAKIGSAHESKHEHC